MKLIIYRPYADKYKTFEVLSGQDVLLMKNNVITIFMLMLHEEKIQKFPNAYDIYKDDESFKYWYNKGIPDVDFLLDYYILAKTTSTRLAGSLCDLMTINGDSSILSGIRHIKNRCNLSKMWNSRMELMHKIYLLNDNYEWYKRHFRDLYCYKMKGGYDLFNNNSPREITSKDIYKFQEHLMIDEMDLEK